MIKHKVVLVDDELLFIKGMRLLLEQEEDIEVVGEASHGREFFDNMNKGTVADVVLLDLSMPVLDGVDTLSLIGQQYPDMKVIILSSHYNDSIILRLLDEGVSGFLAKNESPAEVVRTIRQVGERGFCINDHILQLIRNRRLLAKTKELDCSLSARELEIVNLMCNEYTSKEIASKLFISPRTVDGHRNKILEKTGCKNIAGVVVYAIERNIFEINISKYQ